MRLEKLARNKHSSLLQKSVNYGQIKFYNIGPCSFIIKIEVPNSSSSEESKSLIVPSISLLGRQLLQFLLLLDSFPSSPWNSWPLRHVTFMASLGRRICLPSGICSQWCKTVFSWIDALYKIAVLVLLQLSSGLSYDNHREWLTYYKCSLGAWLMTLGA